MHGKMFGKVIELLDEELNDLEFKYTKLKKIRDEIHDIYKSEAVRTVPTNFDNSFIACNDIELSTEHTKMLNKSLQKLKEQDNLYTIDEIAKILELEQCDIIYYHEKFNDFLNISCIGAFQLYSRKDVENLIRIKHLYYELKLNVEEVKQYLKINSQEVLLNKSKKLEQSKQPKDNIIMPTNQVTSRGRIGNKFKGFLDLDDDKSKENGKEAVSNTSTSKSSKIYDKKTNCEPQTAEEARAMLPDDFWEDKAITASTTKRRKTGKQKLDEALEKYKK